MRPENLRDCCRNATKFAPAANPRLDNVPKTKIARRTGLSGLLFVNSFVAGLALFLVLLGALLATLAGLSLSALSLLVLLAGLLTLSDGLLALVGLALIGLALAALVLLILLALLAVALIHVISHENLQSVDCPQRPLLNR
jgi:hypothetical protein